MENRMFCYQCQETAHGTGCTMSGVCGKRPEVAIMQDLLIYVTKGLAAVSTALRWEGKTVGRETSERITKNLFATITNTNFDRNAIIERIRKTLAEKDTLLLQVGDASRLPDAAIWTGGEQEFDRKASSVEVGVLSVGNEDLRSLQELILYGLKGMAAYCKHANALGRDTEEIDCFLQETLAKLLDEENTVDDLLALAMEAGRMGVDTMAVLDAANTEQYGQPEITTVSLDVGTNPGILISGHDLRDLEMLLEQTQGTGVDVYTHSEMLPAHYYPAFQKFSNLVGNYGNAWWKQREEFGRFHGPILMTTNCIVPPLDSYRDRMWTTGTCGYPGCRHIRGEYGQNKDFSPIIEQARTCPPPAKLECGSIVGGFAHEQLFTLLDPVIDAVNSGAIRQFVVMAGCDGRMQSRNYYREFAEKLPGDTVILTAGCAKYKYNKLELGTIDGIPRILDAGQCNDCYSLALLALRLKEVFDVEDINDLPIVFNISWYEQKAVIVLLALLSLGIRNIHLGPTLPAFLSPNVRKVLEEKFGLSGITTVEEDLDALIGTA